MSNLNAQATNKCFRGLVCPYTGAPITVRVVASGSRRPLYFSPDAFDPSVPGEDAEALLRTVRSRNGIIGSIPDSVAPTCAYTGKPLSFKKNPLGFRMDGGFSPRVPVASPYELAKNLSMRDGKLPEGYVEEKEARVSISDPSDTEQAPAAPTSIVSDDALATADRVAHATLQRPTAVSGFATKATPKRTSAQARPRAKFPAKSPA